MSRAVIHWERIRSLKAATSAVIATAFGAGLFPKAPGTMGTLFAMPLAIMSCNWPIPARLGLWTLLLVAGTWAAKVFDETMKTGDNQCIVMDEVVGLRITAWTITGPLADIRWQWIAAFFLFRAFDILKLPPVRQVDLWSKEKAQEGSTLSSWWGGFGVMADDVLAGFQGLAVMILLQKLFP